jgi:16S rRNA (cytidine1402-2'-O)-methyltransferase
MMSKGKVYLIPSVIADGTQSAVIPPSVRDILPSVSYFLVENDRTARRFLSSLKVYESIEPLVFEVLDKDTDPISMAELFRPVSEGRNVGVISEAGCPGVADPGALAVAYAHQNDFAVVPLVGPSSLVLSLMASGLNGQRFAFHGYLPVESKNLISGIKEYERESKQKKQTQIFIETPYRNNQLMSALMKTLHEETSLTVALDLTGENELVKTYSVRQWKTINPQFPKLPAVFLFLA